MTWKGFPPAAGDDESPFLPDLYPPFLLELAPPLPLPPLPLPLWLPSSDSYSSDSKSSSSSSNEAMDYQSRLIVLTARASEFFEVGNEWIVFGSIHPLVTVHYLNDSISFILSFETFGL